MKEGVKDEDYQKWCEQYKGPFLLGLSGAKRFAPVKMLGGITGNGEKGTPPGPASPPFK